MPEYANVCQSVPVYARVCQSMPEYARVYQSMPEYARVCQSMPEYARVCHTLNDDTKILTETDTETFFPIPNFPKPITRLFFRYQILRNRYRDFCSDNKFSETDTGKFGIGKKVSVSVS